MLPVGKQAMRAVIHRDVDDESTETALSVLRDVLTNENKGITSIEPQ